MYLGVVSFVMILFAALLSEDIAEVIYLHFESVVFLQKLFLRLEVKVGLLGLKGKDS